jgi:hypothetical protein
MPNSSSCRARELELVNFFPDVQFAIVLNKMALFLWYTKGAPVRQNSRKGISPNKFSARAGVKFCTFFFCHFAPKSSFSIPGNREAQSFQEAGNPARLEPFLPLISNRRFLIVQLGGGTMKQSQHFLENAENCAQLAERASDEPTHRRYKGMEEA